MSDACEWSDAENCVHAAFSGKDRMLYDNKRQAVSGGHKQVLTQNNDQILADTSCSMSYQQSGQMHMNTTALNHDTAKHRENPSQDKELLEEHLQDVTVLLSAKLMDGNDMCKWLEEDPLEQPKERQNVVNSVQENTEDYFVLIGSMDEAELDNQKAILHDGLEILRKLQDPEYSAETEYDESDVDWMARLKTYGPDPECFQAGRMHACAEVLAEYFAVTGNRSANAKKLVRSMQHGIKFEFVGVDHKSHWDAPQRKQKEQIVNRMLQMATGQEDIQHLLQGKEPAKVQFPNHKSVQKHAEFVRQELQKALDKGVIKQWTFQEPPHVVNGLKIVEGRDKNRMCINPMYINRFMRRDPVRYEKLQDMSELVEIGDYLTTSDDKSGYWQLSLHPDMWKYVGFEFEGQFYCFPMMPFGIMSACHTYTMLKQEIYRPLRQLGVRMTMLLDDRAACESTRPRARLQLEGLNKILWAVGTTLNVPDEAGRKAQWLPSRQCRFLGFVIDAEQGRFLLPEEKKSVMSMEADQLVKQASISNRQLASMAGKMVAASPAVPLAPLFARGVYKAMHGQQSWDCLYPNGEACKQDLLCFQDALKTSSGGSWWKRSTTLLMAGDASEYAYAAYAPDGEVGDPMVVSFTTEELELMANNEFSSTLREIICMEKTVEVLLQSHPEKVRHKRLVYETDSQTGWYSVMGLKGNSSTFPTVRRLRLLCAANDIELDVVWKPREEVHQKVADLWSKVVDNSEWCLKQSVYDMVTSHSVLQGRKPVLDVFASSATTKVPGAFFSRYLCPGTQGVNAWNHTWARSSQEGKPQVVYVNGPFDQMGAIIRKIKEEKVDCILIGPQWPRHWQALLLQLPVKAKKVLPHVHDLFQPGMHVPVEKRKAKHPKYDVMVWYIFWN